MSKERPRCAVIGAANVDIGGFPSGRPVPRDSNPGRVALSCGGVGRNIAANMARLGLETHLVTALGGDFFADLIRSECRAAGVLLDRALTVENAASSVYLYIADPQGDMALAVSDMDICRSLTPAALEPLIPWLNGMDAVALDANLPAETLMYLAETLRPPLLADAVSAAKAPRLLRAMPRLAAVKPNAQEAEVLTGIPVRDESSARRAAETLVAMGAERAYVTLGADGACCADGSGSLFLPGRPADIVSATGAGDAFTAALVWARVRDLPLRESARAGMAAARLAMESLETVNRAMCESELLKRMNGVE